MARKNERPVQLFCRLENRSETALQFVQRSLDRGRIRRRDYENLPTSRLVFGSARTADAVRRVFCLEFSRRLVIVVLEHAAQALFASDLRCWEGKRGGRFALGVWDWAVAEGLMRAILVVKGLKFWVFRRIRG